MAYCTNVMDQLLDNRTLVYVVVALVPNLFVMLWAMARMHRELRSVVAKLGLIESDNRVLDEGLKVLAEELRQLRTGRVGTPPPLPSAAPSSGGPPRLP